MHVSTPTRRSLMALTAAAIVVLAGCASTYRVEPARLIGSWQTRTAVSGQPGSSVISFKADGNFEERRSTISISTGRPLLLQGTWTLVGDRLRLYYTAGFEGQGTPQVDTRVVSRLSDADFVSADIDYGREVWRTRLVPSTPARP